jgi:enediyne biosynthesis protein E4
VKAGVQDKQPYYGFTAIFISLNANGRPDLVVGNDSQPNYLYINKGHGTFEDDSYSSGFALNGDGREIASMGIAAGDYENNGQVDLFVTDFGDDYKVLYHNDGNNSFSDVSYKVGVARTTIPFVGWGDGFLDYDNDGWLDLFMVNGHVYPQVDQHKWGTSFAERPLLFHNIPNPEGKGRRFEYVPPVQGTGLAGFAALVDSRVNRVLSTDGKYEDVKDIDLAKWICEMLACQHESRTMRAWPCWENPTLARRVALLMS